jgi:hypothetical protein
VSGVQVYEGDGVDHTEAPFDGNPRAKTKLKARGWLLVGSTKWWYKVISDHEIVVHRDPTTAGGSKEPIHLTASHPAVRSCRLPIAHLQDSNGKTFMRVKTELVLYAVIEGIQ